LLDRNIEIHRVVEFLLSPDKRLLQVIGDAFSQRLHIVAQAVKIVMARNVSLFRDGAIRIEVDNFATSIVH
jgi:hypothetical protein